MFDFLLEINKTAYERYLTIEKNIEAKSNSFYDSLLALLESLVKETATKAELDVDESLSFIKFISQNEFKEFIFKSNKINESQYQSIYDISKFINEHKHKKEKDLEIDVAIDFLHKVQIFAEACYSSVFDIELSKKFNASYYYNIYGATEREIKDLKKQREKLERTLMDEHKQKALIKNDYDALKNLTKETELEKKTIEEQKDQLRNEVDKLKDIKLTTMEEKVSRIVDILDRQTDLLESMKEILRKGGPQFGAKPVR